MYGFFEILLLPQWALRFRFGLVRSFVRGKGSPGSTAGAGRDEGKAYLPFQLGSNCSKLIVCMCARVIPST
jgi:hypothetical protein